MKRFGFFLPAIALGTLVTMVTAVLSYFALQLGAEFVSDILFWPNTLLQSLVPLHNIGTAEQPFYEGTPVNIAAALISFPLAVLAYSSLAYIILRRRSSR